MSEKRQPIARITSAFFAASEAGYSPQQPAMPRWSGCRADSAPLPMNVE